METVEHNLLFGYGSMNKSFKAKMFKNELQDTK